MAPKITTFQIEDIGIDLADHFPGRGIALSSWEGVAVGVGETPREAAGMACELLADDGWTISGELEQATAAMSGESDLPESDSDDADEDLCISQHYVAIYVK